MKGKSLLPLILIVLLLMPSGCEKEKEIPVSGTATIDSKLTFDDDLQAWVGYGFLFSVAKLVPTPGSITPDITVYTDGNSISLLSGNYLDSFYLAGSYSDEASASSAFDALKTVNPALITWTGLASPLAEDQVWIYRTDEEQYAKIRITGLTTAIHDDREFVRCTFEWVFQADGSTNFSAR